MECIIKCRDCGITMFICRCDCGFEPGTVKLSRCFSCSNKPEPKKDNDKDPTKK